MEEGLREWLGIGSCFFSLGIIQIKVIVYNKDEKIWERMSSRKVFYSIVDYTLETEPELDNL